MFAAYDEFGFYSDARLQIAATSRSTLSLVLMVTGEHSNSGDHARQRWIGDPANEVASLPMVKIGRQPAYFVNLSARGCMHSMPAIRHGLPINYRQRASPLHVIRPENEYFYAKVVLNAFASVLAGSVLPLTDFDFESAALACSA